MKINKVVVWGVLLAGILMLQTRLSAQDDSDQGPGQDPPGRVARLNYSNGSVSMQPGGEGDWAEAVANRPLTTGDNLWADKDSRAELHIGSTAIRLDSESSLTFLDLDDHTVQLKLSQGSVVLRVRHLDDGDTMEVDTPNLAFDIQAPGEYRIDVNGEGSETDTTVWHGRGEVTGGGASFDVVAGQHARFAGTDQLDHEIDQIPRSDDFDNFAFSRDEKEDHSESANYISPEVTGYEDLDDNGSWHYVADYGTVWTPRGVAADWAPYRDGHWAWIEPWGWTWVEDEPWGFAPFHYGRWAYVQSSWCWVPGPVVVRPVYAPALVAFVGGGGFSLSVGVGGGGGGVAWFPLGPREVYVPWYRTSRVYVNNVNFTNTRVNVTEVNNVYNVYNNRTTNVTRVTYVNQRGPAVTAVARDTFVNARQVSRNTVRVDDRQIGSAQVTTRVDVQPIRASVMGPGGAARFHPSAAVVNRQVVATRTPTAPRASFEQRHPANVNVRTETPGTPQPAGRNPAEGIRPMPGNTRPDDSRQGDARMQQEQGQGRPQAQVPRPPGSQQERNMSIPTQPAPRADQAPRQERQDQPQPQVRNEQNQPQPQVRNEQNQPQPQVRNEQNQPQPQGRYQQNQPQPQVQQARPDQRSIPQPPRPTGNMDNNNRDGNNNRGGDGNRGGMDGQRSQVRQAPPVQQRPEVQRSEEQKFGAWQQQRQNQSQNQNQNQRPAPPPQTRQSESRPQEQRAAPRPAPQPQRDDKKNH